MLLPSMTFMCLMQKYSHTRITSIKNKILDWKFLVVLYLCFGKVKQDMARTLVTFQDCSKEPRKHFFRSALLLIEESRKKWLKNVCDVRTILQTKKGLYNKKLYMLVFLPKKAN